MKRTERRKRERGSQIVELALVVPLLVFLVFVVIEGAAAIRIHQVVNNAAREGARVGSLPESSVLLPNANPSVAIRNAVASYACRNGVLLGGTGACATTRATCAGATIAINQLLPVGTSPTGAPVLASQVSITCTYNFSWIPNLPYINYTTNSVTMGGTAEFRNEW